MIMSSPASLVLRQHSRLARLVPYQGRPTEPALDKKMSKKKEDKRGADRAKFKIPNKSLTNGPENDLR